MANQEGKYLEKANNEIVFIERLEKKVDFLKSEIQNMNNLLSRLLRNTENSKANFQNIQHEERVGNAKQCKKLHRQKISMETDYPEETWNEKNKQRKGAIKGMLLSNKFDLL